MILPGDIISHYQMCNEEGFSLQRGMNFRVKGGMSIILMSVRKGSPYADRVEDNGKILIYEGHDVPKNLADNPKLVNQEELTPSGRATENGKFFDAAIAYKEGKADAEPVKVYEKIKDGIWSFNGIFNLVDSWKEKSGGRSVYKFKLVITDVTLELGQRVSDIKKLDHNRIIPAAVKLEVWKRDGGKCTKCDSTDNLHFDHILPYSRGGTSLKSENIQLLCARHNLGKSNKIILWPIVVKLIPKIFFP